MSYHEIYLTTWPAMTFYKTFIAVSIGVGLGYGLARCFDFIDRRGC